MSQRSRTLDIREHLEAYVSAVSAERAELFRWTGAGGGLELLAQFPESQTTPDIATEFALQAQTWTQSANDPIIDQTPDGKCRAAIPIAGRSRRLGLLITYFELSERASALRNQVDFARLVTALQDLDQLDTSLYLLTAEVATSDSREFLIRFAELTAPLVDADRIVVWLANKTIGRYEAINPPAPFDQSQHYLEERIVQQMGRDQVSVPQYTLPWTDSSVPRLVAAIDTFEQLSGAIEFQFPSGSLEIADHVRELASEVVKNCGRALEGIDKSRRISKLNDALSQVAQAETIEDLLNELSKGALDITNCEIGSVLLLNNETGRLDIARCHPQVDSSAQLSMDEGVIGPMFASLESCTPCRRLYS